MIRIFLASIVLSDWPRALTQPNLRRISGQIVFGKQSILHFLLKPVQKKEQGKNRSVFVLFCFILLHDSNIYMSILTNPPLPITLRIVGLD